MEKKKKNDYDKSISQHIHIKSELILENHENP